ncbi:MAG: ABC transporter substrate-binding protein [Actinomycetes bacterium]
MPDRDRSPFAAPVTMSRRNFVGRSAALMAAFTGGGALLGACGSSDSSTGSAESKVDEVTFLNVIPIESISNTAEMLADAGGHFEKHGLKVTFEATNGSAPAIQTVIQGSALITRLGDIETIVAVAQKDAPLVNVGSVEKGGGLLRFISSKRRPLQKPEDFRGAKMGLPSIGGTSENTLNLVIASGGVPASSVDRQVVGLTPGVFDLVSKGRVDGYVVSLDTSLIILRDEPDALSFAPSSVISAGNQQYTTSERQLQDPEQADQVRRFLLGIHDAIEFVIEDEKNGFEKTMETISAKYAVPAFKDKEISRKSLELYVGAWTADGQDKIVQTNPAVWKATYDEMVDAKIVPGGMNPADWLTDKFAPAGG